MKKLEEMSLEELWQLFPIYLTEHKHVWKSWYEEEQALLREMLPEPQVRRISHAGSTAIETIWAKPIVDIIIETEEDSDWQNISSILASIGYRCMSRTDKRLSFNKGYTENGFADKVYHLHLRYFGDNDELYFRDYLKEHQEIVKEYEELKLELWKIYEHNRDAYTDKKTAFVKKYTGAAKSAYKGRYS